MSKLCTCGSPAKGSDTLCARCETLQVLGLTPDASPADVETAWRMLVKVWHPDRFPGDEKLRRAADEKLKAINAAHARLLAEGEAPRRPRPAEPPAAAPAAEASPQARATQPSRPIRRIGLPRWCLRGLAGAFFLATILVLFKVTDLWLLAQPQIAPMYSAWRANLVRTIAINWNRTWGGIHTGSAAPAQVAAQPETASEPKPQANNAATPVPHVRGVQPYVTVGLTRSEVEAALGTPTEASADELRYGDSVLALLDGRVAGWSISANSPLRVKVWPSTPLSPGVTTFNVGSTRDEVIALQGTPSLLTARKFGYGRSEVYFEDDRVVGWKSNPTSVPLKVPAQ